MNDIGIDSRTEVKLAELDRRVQTLETKVSALPDAKEIESRIKANIPPAPAPVDPSQAPSFRDIAVSVPNVQTIVATAKATWTLFEILAELKTLFWTLFDRRYHMAWVTRFITITLLVLMMTSDWWAPFATYNNFVSRLWDKLIDLVICLVMFMVLSFETRRYKEWRSKH
jgi:hypothetical protein